MIYGTGIRYLIREHSGLVSCGPTIFLGFHHLEGKQSGHSDQIMAGLVLSMFSLPVVPVISNRPLVNWFKAASYSSEKVNLENSVQKLWFI